MIARFEEILALIAGSIALRNEKRWIEALACLDQAIAINPKLALCQVDRAQALAQLHRYEEALDAFDAFLHDAGPSPEIAALRRSMLDDAFAALDRALDERPGDLDALLRRANLLRKTQRHRAALDDYAAILARDANHVDALNHQGSVLLALNRHDEAIAIYSRAVGHGPDRAEVWHNLGNALQATGRLDEARAAYRRALEAAPDFAEAHMEIANCWLSEGNYAAGWPGFEWRWRTAMMKNDPLPTDKPLWLGGRDLPAARSAWPLGGRGLAGKTLLVWAEQGAGDTLQFVRFVPALLAEEGKAILRVQAALRHVVETLDPRIQVVGDDQPLPAHDLHCPLLSLPLALGIDAIAPSAPYLSADPARVAGWRSALGPQQGLRVGIAWAGRQRGVPNPTRDVPLAMLAPLAGPGVELVGLVKDMPAADIQSLDGMPGLRRYGESLADFSDTAALIQALDLVIGVDSAVIHLAGALGKPCWLMLRYSGEWRWGRARSDSPWYPTMRIFRQRVPGDWGEVVAEIAGALRAMASGSCSSGNGGASGLVVE